LNPTYHYILAHGLNVQPAVMQRLAEDLGLPAEQCSLICLPGHAEGESWKEVTIDRWVESFVRQYLNAAPPQANIVYVGYSLGGLLMTYLLSQEKVRVPEKQVLFAPALAFQRWTQIPDLLPASGFDQWLIPSFTPKGYKAASGVTMGVYKILFEISRKLKGAHSALFDIPTLVLCDQRDELIDPLGLQKFIDDYQLKQWDLHVLPSRPLERWGKKHLIIGREYLADEYWARIQHLIDQFLYQ